MGPFPTTRMHVCPEFEQAHTHTHTHTHLTLDLSSSSAYIAQKAVSFLQVPLLTAMQIRYLLLVNPSSSYVKFDCLLLICTRSA